MKVGLKFVGCRKGDAPLMVELVELEHDSVGTLIGARIKNSMGRSMSVPVDRLILTVSDTVDSNVRRELLKNSNMRDNATRNDLSASWDSFLKAELATA